MSFPRIITALTLSVLLSAALFSPSLTQAQFGSNARMSCTPVHHSTQSTKLDCRLSTPETPYFLVAEVPFPFTISKLHDVSSIYSAAFGTAYPARVQDNTVFLAAVDWGNENTQPGFQSIPFDSLSFVVETTDKVSDVSKALREQGVTISLLSPNTSDVLFPYYQQLNLEGALAIDGTLLLEAFMQHVSPTVQQFLKLSMACYEKSASACFTNLVNQL